MLKCFFFPHYNDLSTKILTWDGMLYATGDNRYFFNVVLVGLQLTEQQIETQKTKKNILVMVTMPMRLPSSMQGNVEDVRGCGYGNNSDNVYGF